MGHLCSCFEQDCFFSFYLYFKCTRIERTNRICSGAEENICHNLDLLGEALEEFGSGADYLITHGAEAADVTIRCYLLGECIAAALEEIEDDFNEAHEGEESEEE